jgi:hypothetical protein
VRPAARLRPDAADPLRRDPCTALRSHHDWVEGARAHGAELARLPVSANCVINTSENHSEVHGPYAAWRQELTACGNRQGREIDDAAAARVGLGLEQIRTVSRRSRRRAGARRVVGMPAPRSRRAVTASCSDRAALIWSELAGGIDSLIPFPAAGRSGRGLPHVGAGQACSCGDERLLYHSAGSAGPLGMRHFWASPEPQEQERRMSCIGRPG